MDTRPNDENTWSARIVGRVDPVSLKESRIVVEGGVHRGIDFAVQERPVFVAIGATFIDCNFGNARYDSFSLGAGLEGSSYEGCTFDGSVIDFAPGGRASLAHCSFRDVKISHWNTDLVDIVDCTFSGSFRRSIIWGRTNPDSSHTSPPAEQKRKILNNNFTGVEGDIEFRGGVDLRRQKLPSGPNFFYLAEAERRLTEAASKVDESWPDGTEKRRLLSWIKIYSQTIDTGQHDLLLSRSTMTTSTWQSLLSFLNDPGPKNREPWAGNGG